MRRLILLASLTLVGFAGSAVAAVHAQEVPGQRLPPVISPVVDIPAADQALRQAVGAGLSTAAARFSLQVDTTNFVYASRDDIVVANAAVSDAESASAAADVESGGNLLLAWLSGAASGDQGKALPAGFYAVSLSATPGTSVTVAQLRAADGSVAATVPATVKTAEQPAAASATARSRIKLTVSIEDRTITIDIEFSWGSAAITVPAAGGVTPGSPASS